MTLNVETRPVRYGDCRPQAVNARFMRKEQYDQLVANIARDGTLTSVPLLYQVNDDDPIEIVSGHHRIQAGTEVFGADATFTAMIVRDEQSRDEVIARQISHNAIAGEDDLATLKQLYDELDDVDWRAYSGLDDKTLELMANVDLSSLAEANLDFRSVQIMFLPDELDRAERAFDEARKLLQADKRWLAAHSQHDVLLDAIETTRGAYSIGNIATVLGVILDVFEAHLGDLRPGWYDDQEGIAKTTKWVPLETLTGSRAMPADAAAVVSQAMDRVGREAGMDADLPRWRALELLAAEYLAGA